MGGYLRQLVSYRLYTTIIWQKNDDCLMIVRMEPVVADKHPRY